MSAAVLEASAAVRAARVELERAEEHFAGQEKGYGSEFELASAARRRAREAYDAALEDYFFAAERAAGRDPGADVVTP